MSPLLARCDVEALFRCPRCGGRLSTDAGRLACPTPDCGLSGRPFPEVGGQPALLDFERSVVAESELVARSGGSLIRRSSARGLVGVLRDLASPGNPVADRHARDLVARIIAGEGAHTARPRVLVVGGGTPGNGAEALYAAEGVDILSFDIYASHCTQFIADAHQIPLADASVQAVWIQAVLEHVVDPGRVVAELERVLEPGGLVYAETPFLQHVHEGPWDFTRFTESGHRWLFRRFECLDSGVVAGPATVWVWATEMLVRGLSRSFALGRLARLALSWVRVLDRWIPRTHGSDGASCLYFYGRSAGVSIGPREAVRGYAGAQRAGDSPTAGPPSRTQRKCQ